MKKNARMHAPPYFPKHGNALLLALQGHCARHAPYVTPAVLQAPKCRAIKVAR